MLPLLMTDTPPDLDPHRPKAYSYVRFSTPEQASGDSLRRQMHLAERYALKHGLDLVDASYQDLGVSAFRGANEQTGMLGEFIEAVTTEAIPRGSWLLIESMDRLSRAKPRKAVRLLERICDEGITLVTLGDGKVYDEKSLDEDPMAFMWAFMVAIRANEESATKSRRLKDAWEQKRQRAGNGEIQTTRAPSWLSVIGETERSFIVDETRKNIVQRIFAMTIEGAGQHKIAETLNREGVPPFGRGKHWHRTYVRKLLCFEAVVGTYVPHTIETVDGKRTRRATKAIENYYPRIVDDATFSAAQTMLQTKAPRGRHAASKSVRNVLAGLSKCPHCEGTMTLVTKGPRSRSKLVCTSAKAGAGCKYHTVDYPHLEEAMLNTWHEWAMLDLDTQVEAPEAADLATVRSALVGIDDLLPALLDEFAGHRSTPSAAERIRELELEREHLRKEEAKLSTLVAAASPAMIEVRLGKLQDVLSVEPLDRGAANRLLRQWSCPALIPHPVLV